VQEYNIFVRKNGIIIIHEKLATLNLLHFHGGGKVISVMFDGGQLAQSANNNVLVSAIELIVHTIFNFLGALAS